MKGEKTAVFWAGLTILSAASVELFWVAWGYTDYLYTMTAIPRSFAFSPTFLLTSATPYIVAGIVFVLIGVYMLKAGVKNADTNQTKRFRRRPQET